MMATNHKTHWKYKNLTAVFIGIVIAIIHRTDDDDAKLIVVPDGVKLSDDEIEKAVEFQEKWFKHMIVR